MERWLSDEKIREIAIEEGYGEISDDEVELIRKMTLKFIVKLANEPDDKKQGETPP